MLTRKRCSWNSRFLHLITTIDVIGLCHRLMSLADVSVHGPRESSSFSNSVGCLSVLLRKTFPHRFTVHPSVLVALISPFFWLVVGALVFDYSFSPAVASASFLPDNAEVACRAILPQCFRRSDWADLCAREPSVVLAHPAACRDAEFKPDQSVQGR